MSMNVSPALGDQFQSFQLRDESRDFKRVRFRSPSEDERDLLSSIRVNVRVLETLGDTTLKDDPKFMIKAIGENSEAFEYASDRLKADRDFLSEAAKISLPSDGRMLGLFWVARNVRVLDRLNDTVKGDRDFMLQAVKLNGFAYKYAAENLKNDEEFMLAAIKRNWWVVEEVGANLKNQEFFVKAIVQEPLVLLSESVLVKNARTGLTQDQILGILRKNGLFLEYLGVSVRDNEEYVCEAIKQNTQAYRFATRRALEGLRKVGS